MNEPPEPAALWRAGAFKPRPKCLPQPLFGQVHEDSLVEAGALAAAPSRRRAVVIGSGGCTAFALLAQQPERLAIVDINPAQLWLIELKRAAFLELTWEPMRRAFDGDARPFFPILRGPLTDEARTFWNAHGGLLARGLNHAGLAERNLRRVMLWFTLLVHSRASIRRMLAQHDLAAQRTHFREHWDSWRWKLIFRLALHPRLLRFAYAPEFLANLPCNFSTRMKAQVDDAFLRSPTATNPYLWQTFLQTYPPGNETALPIHLQPAHFDTIRKGLNGAELIRSDLASWLATQPPSSFDFFALSNILEVCADGYPPRLFAEIARTAAPGALVCLRSIYPKTPLPTGPEWQEETALAERLQALDRSLGCRNLHLYRLPDEVIV